MAPWKAAFLKSLEEDSDLVDESDFEFGPPATANDLAALESQISAKLPADVQSLLSEFNGITRTTGGCREPYYFSTQEMPQAVEVYRHWDQPTDLLMQCSRDILYICQENGFSRMWGIAIRPFGPFVYGQVVAFDHDMIRNAELPEELFGSPYQRLIDLVEADWKMAN